MSKNEDDSHGCAWIIVAIALVFFVISNCENRKADRRLEERKVDAWEREIKLREIDK